MKHQLLSTSLLLSLAVSAPVAQPTNDLDTANMQLCSKKPHPSLEDFNKAGIAWCSQHVRANAPNPPLLPKPVIDPKNPPIMPPLRAPYTFKLANPDKKKPEIVLPATFEIRGFAPTTRDMCLDGWGLGHQKLKIQLEQVEKHNICVGQGGSVLVQGWNQPIWWNEFGVTF